MHIQIAQRLEERRTEGWQGIHDNLAQLGVDWFAQLLPKGLVYNWKASMPETGNPITVPFVNIGIEGMERKAFSLSALGHLPISPCGGPTRKADVQLEKLQQKFLVLEGEMELIIQTKEREKDFRVKERAGQTVIVNKGLTLRPTTLQLHAPWPREFDQVEAFSFGEIPGTDVDQALHLWCKGPQANWGAYYLIASNRSAAQPDSLANSALPKPPAQR